MIPFLRVSSLKIECKKVNHNVKVTQNIPKHLHLNLRQKAFACTMIQYSSLQSIQHKTIATNKGLKSNLFTIQYKNQSVNLFVNKRSSFCTKNEKEQNQPNKEEKEKEKEEKEKEKIEKEKEANEANEAKEAKEAKEKEKEKEGKENVENKEEENDQENKDKNKKEEDDFKKMIEKLSEDFPTVFMVFLALFVLVYFFITSKRHTKSWRDLKAEIVARNVQSIEVHNDDGFVVVKLYSGKNFQMGISTVRSFVKKLSEVQKDFEIPVKEELQPIYVEIPESVAFITRVLIIGLLVFGAYRLNASLSRSVSGLMSRNSNFARPTKGASTIRFKDIAGMKEAKVEVVEFVDFLKHPQKFQSLGAKVPKGALLVGPPGTGKTLLAKAIAGESGVTFFSVAGSEFVESFVGVGPARVRELFEKARKNAPSIVFIDEIDAIGRSRASGKNSMGGHDERENTLNQLLVEMDGFTSRENVIVFAGTNRVDVLDKALLRPGRFDRTIPIDPPDIKGRVEIFELYLAKIKLSEPENLPLMSKKLAALTPGFTGADISNVVNEAALIAARNDKEGVEFIDFETAIERVVAGLEKKSTKLSMEEKTRVAYHEAGHAIAGWFLQYAHPLLKVSIVPRGVAALGYAQLQPKDELLISTEEFFDQICAILAGRAAEQIIFKNISSGAQDDLEKITRIVYNQLTQYGMNKEVGNVAYPQESKTFDLPYSQETARKIDHEARKIISEAYDRVTQLLNEKRDQLEVVAQYLLQNEVLRRDEMITLIGNRPWAEKTTYEELIE